MGLYCVVIRHNHSPELLCGGLEGKVHILVTRVGDVLGVENVEQLAYLAFGVVGRVLLVLALSLQDVRQQAALAEIIHPYRRFAVLAHDVPTVLMRITREGRLVVHAQVGDAWHEVFGQLLAQEVERLLV